MNKTLSLFAFLAFLLFAPLMAQAQTTTSDSFVGTSGTNLSAHTPTPSGGFNWTSLVNTVVLDGSGGAYNPTAGVVAHYTTNQSPANINYTVEGDIHFYTVNSNDPAQGITFQDTGNSAYVVIVEPNDMKFYKDVSGTFTQLLTTHTLTSTAGSTVHLKIVVAAGTQTISYGGTTIFAGTDASITAVGTVGIYDNNSAGATLPTATVGVHLQNFSATYTPSPPPVTIAVTDPNLFFNGFFASGSTYMQAEHNGSYVKMAFTGTSVAMDCDTTPESAASYTPTNVRLVYQIDSGVRVLALLSNRPFAVSGLASGTHTIQVWLDGDTVVANEWGSSGVDPSNAVRIIDFSISNGGATVPLAGTALALRPKRAIVYGDSITAGTNLTGGDIAGADPSLDYAQLIGPSLNAEVTQVGNGGTGYTAAYSASNMPAFTTTWNHYDFNHTRSLSGYDYIINFHGTNDYLQNAGASDATVTAAVASQLTSERAANSTAQIILGLPFGSNAAYDAITGGGKVFRHDAIVAGFYAYQAATPDSRCYLVDEGNQFIPYLESMAYTNGTDGIHPNFVGHARIAPVVAAAIQSALTPYLAVPRGQLKRSR